MHQTRTLIAATLCIALLLAVAPAAWAAPGQGSSHPTSSVGWLSWIGSLFGQLMPWGTAPPQAPERAEDDALRSFSAEAQVGTTSGFTLTQMATANADTSDAGIVKDPDG